MDGWVRFWLLLGRVGGDDGRLGNEEKLTAVFFGFAVFSCHYAGDAAEDGGGFEGGAE